MNMSYVVAIQLTHKEQEPCALWLHGNLIDCLSRLIVPGRGELALLVFCEPEECTKCMHAASSHNYSSLCAKLSARKLGKCQPEGTISAYHQCAMLRQPVLTVTVAADGASVMHACSGNEGQLMQSMKPGQFPRTTKCQGTCRDQHGMCHNCVCHCPLMYYSMVSPLLTDCGP